MYVKPSPHNKAGPWQYGAISNVPQPRSYEVQTPGGVTRRNRVHVRPAAPPPPGAMVPKSWSKYIPTRSLTNQRLQAPNTPLAHPPAVQEVHVPDTSQQTDGIVCSNPTPGLSPPSTPIAQPQRDTQCLSPPWIMSNAAKARIPPSPGGQVVTRSGRVSKAPKKFDL